MEPTNFTEFVGVLIGILNIAIPVIFALSLLSVLWAGSQMILNSDNPQKLSDSRSMMMWGIIVLVVMGGMWGFVNLVATTFF